MSGKLMGACYSLRLKRGQRDVLMAYADFADDNGVCWPANDTIAWMCDITSRHVQRVKQELYDLDLLSVIENPQGGRYQFTVYQLNVDALLCRSLLNLQKPRKGDLKGDTITSPFVGQKGDTTMQKDDVLGQRATSRTRKGDTVMSDNPDTVMSPDPSVDPPSFDPALNPSIDTLGSSTSFSNSNSEADSDSLRSSGASLRSDADMQTKSVNPQEEEERSKARVEKCKELYRKFGPASRKLMIDIELGNDHGARAAFKEWLAGENESEEIKTATA